MGIEPRSVGSLWIGDPISPYERLSLASFARQGHEAILYSFTEQPDLLPSVQLRDAREVCREDAVFNNVERSYSFSMFSDWFRYRMIRDKHHVWADTDLVCLAPLPQADPLFAWVGPQRLNNALLYADPTSQLIAELVRRTEALEDPAARDVPWATYGPELLTDVVNELGLTRFALDVAAVYPIGAVDMWRMFDPEWRDWCVAQTAGAITLHLWNSKIQQAGVKEMDPPLGSFLDDLMQRHEIGPSRRRIPIRWVREKRRQKEGADHSATQGSRNLFRRMAGRLGISRQQGAT